MTLLFLIAFVYLLFAYQNYLNKKANQDESSGSNGPLAQPIKGLNMPTPVKAESFESPIFVDSEIKSEPLPPDSVKTNKEQKSLNSLSSSNKEISSPGNEDTTIDNLGENESIHDENRTVSELNDVIANQIESEESVSNSQTLESMQEEIVGPSFGEEADLQEEENEEVSPNAESLADESNEDRYK